MPLVTMPDGQVVEMPDNLTPELAARLRALQSGQAPAQQPEQGVLSKIRSAVEGVVEPAASIASGLIAAPIAGIAGAGREILTGDFGKGTGERTARAVQEALTYQPRSQTGKERLSAIAQGFEESKLAGLPVMGNEMATLGRLAGPATRQAAPIIAEEAQMAARAAAPIVEPIRKGAEKVGGAAESALAYASGKTPEVFRKAFDAGKKAAWGIEEKFAANARGEVPIENILMDARDGLVQMQTKASEAYKGAKTGWAADKTQLKFDSIENTFNRLEATTMEGGKSLIGTAERNKINEVRAVLDEWKNDPSSHTTLGLDGLKRRIDAIYPDNPQQAQAQRVIAGTRAAVKSAITTQAPDYAQAMSNYESAMSNIRDITKTLSIGSKTSKDAAIKKLMSLSKDVEFRRAMAEKLRQEGGPDIMEAIAGQSLSRLAPEGWGRLSAGGLGGLAFMQANPWLAVPAVATSPRLLGEMFYGAGKLKGKLSKPPAVPEAPSASTALVPYTSVGDVNPPTGPNWVPGRGYGPVVNDSPPPVAGALPYEGTDFSRMARQREAFDQNMVRQTAIEGEVLPQDPNWTIPQRGRITDQTQRVPNQTAPELPPPSTQRLLVDAELVKHRQAMAQAEAEYASWAEETARKFKAEQDALYSEYGNTPRVRTDMERKWDKIVKREEGRRRAMERNMKGMRDREAELERLQEMLSSPRSGSGAILGPGPLTREAQRGMLTGATQ